VTRAAAPPEYQITITEIDDGETAVI